MNQDRKDSFELLLRRHLSSEVMSKGALNLCPDENVMNAYLEGTQGERFNSEFEKHLLKCSRCQEELALLLKSGVLAEESSPVQLVKTPEAKSPGIFPWFWSWMKPFAMRPAFAVLVVSLLSALIGYRLIRQHDMSGPTTRVARSMQKENSSPLPSDLESGGLQPYSASKREAPSREGISDEKQNVKDPVDRNGVALESERKNAFSQSVPKKSAVRSSRDAGGVREEQYAAEPVADAVSQAERARPLNQTRSSASPPAAPPQEDSKTVSKESISSQEGRQQQDFKTTKARSEDARGTSGERLSGKPQGAAVPAAPAAIALSKTDREKMTERDDQTETASTRAKDEKKQSLEGVRREALGLAVGPLQRIEAGGKLFELRGDLWRDSSISENGQASPVVIGLPSREFESLRKVLGSYQPVLSRPEDVLIKLNDRIYRIKKVQKTRD
jgi:hypothetical protein